MSDDWMKGVRSTRANESWACNCIGPQNGQPLCPCMMRGVTEKNGRWVRTEQDLGPVSPGYGYRPEGKP